MSDLAIPLSTGGPAASPTRPGSPRSFQRKVGKIVDIAVPEPAAAGPDSALAEALRKQVARELHDQLAQGLTSMLVRLEQLKRLRKGDPALREELDELLTQTREIFLDVRELLDGLRGGSGWQEDFVVAVKLRLATRFQRRFGAQVRVRVAKDWPARIRSVVALNLLRIIQEAMSNAVLHGGARSIRVVLRADPARHLEVLVIDDGSGLPETDDLLRGQGLLGMRERSQLIGGELCIRSSAAGTVLKATIPWRTAV
ncbi:MAG: hypothetical protein E6J02_00660 [Chloroflexi bacterium]|nr:MAG: hypothetical protein E6J02_00660 [Chloroflexota bacterium]TME16503.1 MAG: hypothetical protein E6I63_05905 [Chloroflexota bacterium]TME16672.1 MAG: hypothetical protein E6I70_12015 [Chloroflexota bacterium]